MIVTLIKSGEKPRRKHRGFRRNFITITIKKSSVVTLLKKLIVFCYNMLNPTVIKSHHHSDDLFIITSQYTYCLDPRYHEIINQYNAWIIKYFNL